MSRIKNVAHHTIFKHDAHCVNQIATRVLANGEIVAVFNEERFPYHHDSGQTLLIRSRDGGVTWDPDSLKIVLPWSATTGNWDCGFCELDDGTWLVNMTITGFFKRGIKPEQPSWSSRPLTAEWGDWTWAYKTQGWLGTFVVKSTDRGATWSQPIPVNLKLAGPAWSPSVTDLDLKPAVAQIVKEGGAALIGRALGVDTSKAQEAGQQKAADEAAKAQQKLEEEAKNRLKGLFGK